MTFNEHQLFQPKSIVPLLRILGTKVSHNENHMQHKKKSTATHEKFEFVERQGSVLNNVEEDPVHEEPDQNVDEKKGDWVPLEEVVKGPRGAKS